MFGEDRMTATVGIIANPASGKDIRRLVAHGSVFDNQEKVNIVRRVLLGLQATGVDEVFFMPDYFGIGRRAREGLKLSLETSFLDMRLRVNQEDSTRAATLMREMAVGCIVVLGGDGTNRVVAKGCGAVPLMPISTGTNNVFPTMIEGTIAGLAAGVVASRIIEPDRVTNSNKRLEIERGGSLIDIALVDVVVYDDVFVASRAVWDMSKVREVVLARAAPDSIGLSSVGGCLYPDSLDERHGVHITLGSGDRQVVAPIAPGLVARVSIEDCRLIELEDKVKVKHRPSILALDGEREVELGREDRIDIRLTSNGPRVIDVKRALKEAARRGFFLQEGAGALRPAIVDRQSGRRG
jgi:predicted polyphosphate/ATP-dependent NAD kinase